MKCLCGETDITSVFGTDVPGSSPGGGTKRLRKRPAALSPLCAGRNMFLILRNYVAYVLLTRRKTVRRGRRILRATASKISVTTKVYVLLWILLIADTIHKGRTLNTNSKGPTLGPIQTISPLRILSFCYTLAK